jgi:hypothetical protein
VEPKAVVRFQRPSDDGLQHRRRYQVLSHATLT